MGIPTLGSPQILLPSGKSSPYLMMQSSIIVSATPTDLVSINSLPLLSLEQAVAKASILADAPNEQDLEFIADLMLPSAGKTTEGVTVYRYYYVAARRLQTQLEMQAIKKDSGTELTGYVVPIETLLNLQLAIDLSTPLVVPLGFSAQEALNQLCGCGGGSSATIMSAFVI